MKIFKYISMTACVAVLSTTTVMSWAPAASAQVLWTDRVKGSNVTEVTFKDGTAFRQISPTYWDEVSSNGKRSYTFREVDRDEWSVYLRDDSRKMDAQIDLHRKWLSLAWPGQAEIDYKEISTSGTLMQSDGGGSLGFTFNYWQSGSYGDQREKDCKTLVQGRVAWNRSGNTSWGAGNLNNLCANTADVQATITCFKRGISSHGEWQKAINDCRAK